MMKQQSSRIQRAKGFKLKYVLQICVLIAICVWLIYQVKHSHDKKKAFEEKNPRTSSNVNDEQLAVFDLGRKDLARIVDIPIVETESGDETETETATETEEERSDEGDEEKKSEGIEVGGGRGGGDDEIDELDQEKADEEAERSEQLAEEEDRDAALGQLKLFDSEEHEGGASQEAREESFKGDDASSAVFEDTQKTGTDLGGDPRKLDEEQLEIMEKNEDDDRSARDDSGVNESLLSENVNTNEEQLEIMEKKVAENVASEVNDGSANGDDSSVNGLVDDSTKKEVEVESLVNENGVTAGSDSNDSGVNVFADETVKEKEAEIVANQATDDSPKDKDTNESTNSNEEQSEVTEKKEMDTENIVNAGADNSVEKDDSVRGESEVILNENVISNEQQSEETEKKEGETGNIESSTADQSKGKDVAGVQGENEAITSENATANEGQSEVTGEKEINTESISNVASTQSENVSENGKTDEKLKSESQVSETGNDSLSNSSTDETNNQMESQTDQATTTVPDNQVQPQINSTQTPEQNASADEQSNSDKLNTTTTRPEESIPTNNSGDGNTDLSTTWNTENETKDGELVSAE